jgi:hypothetical protein
MCGFPETYDSYMAWPDTRIALVLPEMVTIISIDSIGNRDDLNTCGSSLLKHRV